MEPTNDQLDIRRGRLRTARILAYIAIGLHTIIVFGGQLPRHTSRSQIIADIIEYAFVTGILVSVVLVIRKRERSLS